MSKEFKGTPGPWSFEHDNECFFVGGDGDEAYFEFFSISNSIGAEVGRVELEADANLIAAAPDLLELLIELIDIEGPQPGDCKWAKKVKFAIARALGEKQ